MAGLNEIKMSIANVESTRKITRAMYLISASKSKSAKAKLEKTRSHFYKIAVTLSEIIAETEDLRTPYFSNSDNSLKDKNLYIVLSGDKGQAGAYNQNLVHLLEGIVNKEKDTLWVAGFMGKNLIRTKGFPVSSDFTYPVMNPNLFRAREIAELTAEAYLSGEYHHIYLVYTNMISMMKLEPCMVQLLPLKPEDLTHHSPTVGRYEKAVYEPSPKVVFEHLVPHYLKGILYGALVNSFSSEQNARMFAMDNATKSANDMITNLSKRYNRVRQAQITQEINEIVGGIPAE